ncbi:glycopolymer--peptidoglycan transferase LytR [Streptococcus loxodontisalivarius]|uniref:LCP family protein required for cell wall assembly n=1 Tax=Streptococcus loxodontisalivarius TaxID=1349415 RepID=A0ABS2PUB0_9STRE|nr:LCP family protein [Streptococcus loxodontisalivarius]MBM7643461.1 LCP family protein required for cell wall assembly [Streptococcus loxodontisalivarius]
MKLGKKILLMLGLIFLTTIVAAGVYVTDALNFSNSALSKTFKEYGDGETSTALQNTKPFSILLMGVDTGDSQRTDTWSGNSDSMILVTVNPETKTTTMTSLERDILVNITNDGETYEAKLNAAYAAGGAELAISTIEGVLDINIDYYMQINMQGLVDLVNAVGGITVTNSFDFPISISENEPEYTATVEPGTHLINGEQALVFARMRYDDPEGDYGRQKRQREVIQKVMAKLLNLNSVASYKKILEAVSANMQTNVALSTSTIPQLLGYSSSLKNITEYQLKGEDATLNGGSYQIATTDNLLEIQNNIKKQLGLTESTADTLKTTAVLYEDVYGSYSSDDTSSYDSTYSNGYDTTGGYTDSGTVTYDNQAGSATYGDTSDATAGYNQGY